MVRMRRRALAAFAVLAVWNGVDCLDLIPILRGIELVPNATLPAPHYARDDGVCVTLPDEKERHFYKHANSLLISIKLKMEIGVFSMLPIENGAFYAPPNEEARWGCAWNSTHFVQGRYPKWWRQPDEELASGAVCGRTLEAGADGVIFWHNHYSDNFDHYLVDHLLVIMWLVRILPSGIKIAVPEEKHPRAYVDFFPSLKERVLWFKKGEVTCVDGTILSVEPPMPARMDSGTWRMTTLAQNFHEQALKAHGTPGGSTTHGKVILCSRADALNGRRLGNEAELANMMQNVMAYYGRREEFVVFCGGGRTLQQQFELFSTAKVMIGGDGSALANMMWGGWSRETPDEEPLHVIEGVCGKRSKIRTQCPYFRTHLLEYALAPWVSYHHVVFNASSTGETTWIDIEDVEEILHSLWSDHFGAEGPNTFCLPRVTRETWQDPPGWS